MKLEDLIAENTKALHENTQVNAALTNLLASTVRPATAPPPQEPANALDAKPPTVEAVREAAIAVNKKFGAKDKAAGKAKVLELLKPFGAEKPSGLAEEDRQAFVDACNCLLVEDE